MAYGRSPGGHGFAAWLSLLPLFLSIRLLRPGPALLAGLTWGACFFVVSTLAIGADVPLTWHAMALLSGVPALYACGGALLTRRLGFQPFVLAVGWMAVELGLTPLGLNHGLLADAAIGGTILGAVGNLLGYVLVAFLVAYTGAFLLAVLTGFCLRISFHLPARRWGFEDSHRRFGHVSQAFWSPPGARTSRPRAPPSHYLASADIAY